MLEYIEFGFFNALQHLAIKLAHDGGAGPGAGRQIREQLKAAVEVTLCPFCLKSHQIYERFVDDAGLHRFLRITESSNLILWKVDPAKF